MTQRTSSVRLSIVDDFSTPLQRWSQGLDAADKASERLAHGLQVTDQAAMQLAAEVSQQGVSLLQAAQSADMATVGQNKLALAEYNAQQAALQLAIAQRQLQENTDPEKQRALEGAVLQAQVALDRETQSALKLHQELTTTSTATQKVTEANHQLAESTTPIYDAYQSIQGQLLPAIGIVTAFGLALKQSWELGAQGAAVAQTTESFDTMLRVIGAAPDLLNQLRSAARGTVDDLTLMSSVQLLLAGTSGSLSTEFADATPKLLEMAMAAHKINPALGDTNFLFDSIARGIKRSSPLILDNLGIVVKLGPAYAAYAASVGKSTDELTGEEKQIALLNAVLAKYEPLMKQAGGSTEAAGEQMAAAATKAKNAWDNFLERTWYPFVDRAATGASVAFFGGSDIDSALQQHEAAVRATASSYEEYVTEVTRAEVAAERLSPSILEEARARVLSGEANSTYLASLRLVSRAEFDHEQQLKDTATESSEAQRATDRLASSTYLSAKAAAEGKAHWLAMADAMGITAASADNLSLNFDRSNFSLSTFLEQSTRVGGDFVDQLDKLVSKLGALEAANGSAIPPAADLNDLILDAAIATDDYNAKVEKAAKLQADMAETSKKLADETDPEKQAELAAQMTNLERESRKAERAIRDAGSAMGDANTAAGDASGGFADYTGAIEKNHAAIHDLIMEQFSASLMQQLDTLAKAAETGADTEDAFQRTLDALRKINPELAHQLEVAHGLSLIEDTLGKGLLDKSIDAGEYAQIVNDFVTNLANGVPYAEAVARAMWDIKRAADSIPANVRTDVWIVTHGDYGQPGDGAYGGGDAPPVEQPTDPNNTDDTNHDRRALGGPVMAGRPYTVGENEPETFVPGSDGYVLTGAEARQALAGRSSAGKTIIYNTTINDAMAATLWQEQMRRDQIARAEARM